MTLSCAAGTSGAVGAFGTGASIAPTSYSFHEITKSGLPPTTSTTAPTPAGPWPTMPSSGLQYYSLPIQLLAPAGSGSGDGTRGGDVPNQVYVLLPAQATGFNGGSMFLPGASSPSGWQYPFSNPAIAPSQRQLEPCGVSAAVWPSPPGEHGHNTAGDSFAAANVIAGSTERQAPSWRHASPAVVAAAAALASLTPMTTSMHGGGGVYAPARPATEQYPAYGSDGPGYSGNAGAMAVPPAYSA